MRVACGIPGISFSAIARSNAVNINNLYFAFEIGRLTRLSSSVAAKQTVVDTGLETKMRI